jgi:hypothetical protein
MKFSNRSALLSVTLLSMGLAAVSTAAAQVSLRSQVQQVQKPAPAPKVVSKAHQPVGTPHKASSYAPHPTARRVFGAPIQSPILTPTVQKKAAPK